MVSRVCNSVLALCFLFFSYCAASSDKWIFTTNECSLIEPIYNHTFDFTKLHSDLAHTVISNREDVFNFNICGNLTKPCDGQTEVAACLKRGSKEYILGTQHQLTYKDGKMFFTFTNGSKCKDDTQFQLHVMVGCDYILDKVQSQITSYSEDACSFYILLETPRACLPEPDSVKRNLCTAKDPSTGYTYNLLALSDNNYRTTDRNGSMFVVNVCKPVLYAEAAMCPPGSSVCLINMNSSDPKKIFLNYGTVEANPVVENGQLLIRHNSDTVCNATHNYTSIIYFNCDREIEYGAPDFMGRKGCIYEFSWLNAMACNTIEPCVAIDPITGFKYNMNSLKNEAYNLQLGDKTYSFGVCSNAGQGCLENAGACETINGQSTTLGNSNSNLRFNQTGSPYLLYQTGAPCQLGPKDKTPTTTFWSTKIEFVCAANGIGSTSEDGTSNQQASGGDVTSAIGPKIIENSNCQLLIHYQTKLACQNQITCKTRAYVSATSTMNGGHDMDLTPLISTTDNYEAKVSPSIPQSKVGKSMKFYLNVCRPLIPKYGLGCPGGSAACMAVMGQTTPENEQSLGYPDVSLTSINETSVELKYFRGSPCPADKSTQLSSTIQFTCDVQAGRGTPVLESIISDCHYQFVWPTSVICPAHLCAFNVTTCEIFNEQLNERFNMRTTVFTENGKFKVPGPPEYNIDVCSDDHTKALTDYSQSTVKLFFISPGLRRTDESVTVELRLVCSEKEDASSLRYGGHPHLTYTQRTPEICKFLGLDIPKSGTPSAVSTTSSTTGAPATSTTGAPAKFDKIQDSGAKSVGSLTTILIVVISVVCIALCLGILLRTPERRERVVRLFRRSSSAVRYSRVESNEEANLLLDQNGQFTDSDDDMLL